MIRLTEEEKLEIFKKGKKDSSIEIAIKMLSHNLDVSTISEYTGLSEKEIIDLKKT